MKRQIVIIFLINLICISTIFSKGQEKSSEKNPGNIKMELMVISDYGSREKIISKNATPKILKKTMNSLDWKGFHQVILSTGEHNYIEAGGSLDPSDGLCISYEENGEEFVMAKPPKAIQEMTDILLLYLSGDKSWIKKYKWN